MEALDSSNAFGKVALVFACLNLTVALASPAAPAEALADATSEAQAIIKTELVPRVPGLAATVAVGGQVVWSQGFGYADLAAKTPVTPATRFRIGSVSKPLTAAGLALLIERGQLDVDVPVQKYIPDFPRKGAPITIRLLAGHLSGIRNYRGGEAISDKPYPNLRAALELFENDPLRSPPGTKFYYSSYNWNVIGVAMEAAAKQPFLDFMQDQVFKPLGMINTRPDLACVTDPQRTMFYETDAFGKFVIAPEVNLSSKWPSAGFLSTSEDLARFGSAHLAPGFLRTESCKLLFTSQETVDGKPTHYGVGWFVGRTVLYHPGDSVGGSSILLLLPASRTVVAIVTNRGHLVFGSTMTGKMATRQADLNLARTAQKVAKAFLPLSSKPEANAEK